MKIYIESIVPRLKEFSSSLDKKEIFIDKSWVVVDKDMKVQKYIFRRNGDLVMSVNGQVHMGKWEYISAAKSLLIDRIVDKILLNQNFIDPGIMILKRDGFANENLILANDALIPDLDVASYLKKIYYKKNNIVIIKLKSGQDLELLNYNGTVSNNIVSIEGEPIPDTTFELARLKQKFVIQNSTIHKILIPVDYKTNLGEITIEQEQYNVPSIGESVFQNQTSAPDGKYKLSFMNYIHIKNGVIIKKKIF